jgi:hypothetical protein
VSAVAPVPPPAPAAPAEALPDGGHKAVRARVLKGEWPQSSPRITLELEHVKARDAFKRLAAAAHWSVKFKDSPHGRIDAFFNNVPSDEVLVSILKETGLVGERSGDVITIRQAREEDEDSDESADAEDAAAGSTASDEKNERTGVGSSVKVADGETVKEAVSVGGNVEVDGTVLRDAVSVGGDVKLGPKAVVGGDAVSVGGSLDIDPAAKVGGSRVSMGLGSLSGLHLGKKHHEEAREKDEEEHSGVGGFFWDLGTSAARYTLFFVFGLLLILFAPDRVKSIGRELRRAPGRCVAVGLVGMVLLVPLCVLLVLTLIGILLIPFVGLAVALAVLLGMTAVALEIGERLPPHQARRTQVLILALGVVVLFLATHIPFIGWAVLSAALVVSFGATLRTRFGGNRLDANFVPEP